MQRFLDYLKAREIPRAPRGSLTFNHIGQVRHKQLCAFERHNSRAAAEARKRSHSMDRSHKIDLQPILIPNDSE
jgi:hypothetical protein